MASLNILFITPGQLSPAVKEEQARGTPDEKLLATIAERGLYAGSKQITQEVDISLLIKKVRVAEDSSTHLDMLIEKHRASEVVEDRMKHWALPFPPNGMPIPDDLHLPKGIHHKL